MVLAKKALMEVEDKLLLSQKKEDAEGRERARKLGSARRRIQTARCNFLLLILYCYELSLYIIETK